MNTNHYSPSVTQERVAVGSIFLALGVSVGSWVSRIPEVQTKLALGDGPLGLALLMSAFGAMIAMPIASRFAPKIGTRRLAAGSALSMCLILPLIPLAPHPAIFMAVLAAFGAATGVMGVATNDLAVHVETLIGRPILSSFHGLFSVGGLLGSLAAAALVTAGIDPVMSLAGTSVGLIGMLLSTARWLPTSNPAPAAHHHHHTESKPRRSLVVLGILAFLGLLGEGSMADWSAVYLRQSLGAAASVAALGFAAYSLGMTLGRFLGDKLTHYCGDEWVLRGGSALAATGLMMALVFRFPVAAIVGLTFVGAGLANAVPIIFRAASRVPGVSAVDGIATASTVGYLGFLAGPPLIGAVAEFCSLPVGLSLVAGCIAAVAVFGSAVNVNQGARSIRRGPATFDRHESALASAEA
jgi:Na+/melibiose symporter-like transporter